MTFIDLHFVICAFPQLNDIDYELSQNFGFRDGDMKEECSTNFLNSSNDEGKNPVLQVSLVLYCVHLDTFILI